MANSTTELVLVSGYSGIGKSSVVNELHRALVPPRGLFASGKFDQYKRDIPYATLGQAFQSLVRSLLARSEEELGRWRDALRGALGPNGQLIVNLVPELELVIGKQPPVPDLPPQDAQNRFQMVFRRFLGVFARKEHPLALFLDDLQWLDAATLDLLEHLVTHPEVRHLLLVGAYRDNEVGPSHPLLRTLDAIRKAGAAVQEISLAPLAREHLGQLIADTLRCEPESAAPLAQLVHQKTGGNPFFAIQFISALAEEGLLTFDHDAARWRWDLDRIHAKGYADNVVDLMVGKLTRLPVGTQAALQQLACLGNVAEITMLSIVLGKSNEASARLSGRPSVWSWSSAGGLVHSSVHDRVQEAAYSLIPERLRAEAHLRIGRLLVAHTPPEKREEAIFEIVNQLNRGAALITSRDEREQLAELNLIAGRRAKAVYRLRFGATYLTAGEALLPEDSWERRHELTFALELHRAECEFLTGALAAAEERLSMLPSRAGRLVDFAAVTRLREELFTTLGRSDRAIEVCLDYLRHVGVEWSTHPTKEEVRQEYERIWRQIGRRSIEELVDLPLMTDPEWRATMDVLTAVVSPALFTDENLLCLVICRMANLSLEHGNSDASCFAYVWLGMLLGPRFGDYRAGFRFGKLGLDLVEQRGLRSLRRPASTWTSGTASFPGRSPSGPAAAWCGAPSMRPTNSATSPLRHIVCDNLITNLLASGDPLGDVQREAEPGSTSRAKRGSAWSSTVITTQLGLIRTLRGLTPEFASFNDTEFDEGRFEQHLKEDRTWRSPPAGTGSASCRRASSRVPTLPPSRRRRTPNRFSGPRRRFFELAEYHFYAALTRAALCDTAPPRSGPSTWRHWPSTIASSRSGPRTARRTLRTARLWSPPRSRASKAASSTPSGFTSRPSARPARAASSTTRRSQTSSPHVSTRRVASKRLPACICRMPAMAIYAGEPTARCGNSTRCIHTLGRKSQRLLRRAPSGRRSNTSTSRPCSRPSQAVSGEIVLGELIKTLLRIAIEHAGAERGLLILFPGDEPLIAAEATTGRGQVEVTLRETPVTAAELPESVIHYVTADAG